MTLAEAANLGETRVHERLGKAKQNGVQVNDEALGRDGVRVDAHCRSLCV